MSSPTSTPYEEQDMDKLPPEAEIDDRDFSEGEDTKVDLEKVITEQEYDGE